MELLEFPNKVAWDKRRTWIDNEIEESIRGSHLVSDHATALFMDLQACYCIGAWLSVVILSVAVIDAHLRETEASDNKIGTAKLLAEFYEGPEDVNWLRKLRNKYVHVDIDNPALDMDIQFGDKSSMEADANMAIKMVIKALFQNAGT